MQIVGYASSFICNVQLSKRKCVQGLILSKFRIDSRHDSFPRSYSNVLAGFVTTVLREQSVFIEETPLKSEVARRYVFVGKRRRSTGRAQCAVFYENARSHSKEQSYGRLLFGTPGGRAVLDEDIS